MIRTLRQLPNPAAPLPEPVALAPEMSGQDAGGGMSLAQFLTIARSYWKITAGIAFGVALLSAVVIKFLPKTYSAMATLIVNTQSKDPLAGPAIPDNGLEAYVATQMELMTSPVVLLVAVDRLNLTQDREFAAGFRGGGTDALRDYVEKNLAATLDVEQGRGGELLYVTASARDPVRAATIANTVTDVFIEQQLQRAKGPAEERAARYSQELAELRAKATAAQDKVTEFRRKNAITDITANANDTEQQALTELSTRLLDAQNQERALEAKQTGEQSVADETLQSQQVSQLKTQLNTLNTQLAQDSETLGPKHPKVLELRSQIALAQKELDHAVATLSANTSTDLTRVRALEAKLTDAVAAQRAKLLHLRQTQDDGTKLELELESAQAVYKRALDGYDQIMFASVGDSNTLGIVARATPPVRPAKPNKIKLMILGLMAGLGFGIAIPLAYELLLHRRLRCRDDIERSFGIPVLAEFDALPPHPVSA